MGQTQLHPHYLCFDLNGFIHNATAALKVDYLAPTPVGVELELRSIVKKIKGRK